MPDVISVEEDMRAIEALNQHDVDATKAGDIDAVIAQWTEDFVTIPSVGPIVRGRVANADIAEQGRATVAAIEQLEHVVDFEEIVVCGESAFEWGTYRGKMRPRAGSHTIPYSGKVMRILKRQPDGGWKIHRTMIINDAATP